MGQTGVVNKTLVLNNWNNNFLGDVRVDAGTIRVSNGAALGASTAASASSNGASCAAHSRCAA